MDKSYTIKHFELYSLLFLCAQVQNASSKAYSNPKSIFLLCDVISSQTQQSHTWGKVNI